MTIASRTPQSDTIARITADVDATLSLLEDLRAGKTDIAAMRRAGLHTSAGIARDEMLCRVERWLDPAGLAHRAELQAEQGKQAAALALDIDPRAGF